MSLDLVLGALLIFALRVVDVSLGTLRIAMLVRGQRTYAGLLGFFEALIWLLAVAQVITNLDNVLQIIAYAAGYAAGTMLGTSIERWIAIGNVLLRVIERVDGPSCAEALREAGHYATVMNAEGRDGTVKIIFSVIPRRKQASVLKIIQESNPKAYVTFEQTTRASGATVATLGASRVRK